MYCGVIIPMLTGRKQARGGLLYKTILLMLTAMHTAIKLCIANSFSNFSTLTLYIQLYMQMKVYAEAGGKPQNWDTSQKGTIITQNFNDIEIHPVIKLLGWSISRDLIYKLCLAEYTLVSISLVLVIAKVVPVYHSKLVSKVTTQEYRSLYWGTVVVSNCFTLGLLFPAGRGFSIMSFPHWFFFTTENYFPYFTLFSILEITMYIVFFVAAVIATRRSNVGIIHIPNGMAKVLIHISSCFCCCCCCSSRCRAKGIRVLVLFSFMSFIYHSIMDAISVGYMLFVSVSVTFTMTMLYISLLFFLVSLTSVILYTSTRRDSRSAVKGSVMCIVGTCTLLIIFCAVILIVTVYVIIITSLKPKGVVGFATSLIPSLGLSAAGWLIKKKLQSEVQSRQQASDYGATGQSLNDGGREDRENSEDTEEQRHLLA